MSNSNKIASFLGALAVKLVMYVAVSCVFMLLFWWAGIIKNFSWKYVAIMALGILFLRIFMAEILVKPDKK